MNTRERLNEILDQLPETRLFQIEDFARYLYWQEKRTREEREDWLRLGMKSLARAYGPNEPEYTIANVIRDLRQSPPRIPPGPEGPG